MVRHWTMKYEGKHSYFKHLATVMGNFTNVCYSLALCHQLYQCYLNLNKNELPAEKLEAGPGYKIIIKHCFIFILGASATLPDNNFFNSDTDIDQSQTYAKYVTCHCIILFYEHNRVNWVVDGGIKFESGACVVLKVDTEGEITFGQIISVYLVHYVVLLEVKVLQVLDFDHHFHAFCVTQNRSQNLFICASKLQDSNVYGLYSQPLTCISYSMTTNKYIVLKYSIPY